ncbi:MAG: ABC transporter ATP-binding protein [Phycisphaerae bacterium]|nr:ABC transporter ATP-binding protein [Phycisphaerae bacterium]
MRRLVIRIRGLTKHYVMGDTVVRALDGVDVDVEEGEFLAITGPSGSGKSTMMHLIGCLDRPTSGTYELDGVDVSRMDDGQLAATRNSKIGFVFQTFNLIQRTSAVDNVAVPLFYARRTRVREPAMKALARVGLAARCDHTPSELSGGERQRVAIARAIVNEPRILLADEPTGNLDSKTGRQIMDIFHDLHRSGVTIILVTHEMSVALQARRIVRMRDGRILDDRPVDDALRDELMTTSLVPDSPPEPSPGPTSEGVARIPVARPVRV